MKEEDFEKIENDVFHIRPRGYEKKFIKQGDRNHNL